MIVWGLVPARGGSKSIPLKNMLRLGGRPLLDYVVRAAQASDVLARVICSTDDATIANHARDLGIEVDARPARLATDDAKVDDMAADLLARSLATFKVLPDVVVLLQPTSPFVQPQDVRDIVELFRARPGARSVHNIAGVSHNLHAWNQRLVDEDGAVSFLFGAERSQARNKQQKPKLFAFGNLIAARSDALLAGDGFYAKPAYATTITSWRAFDLDQPEDVASAEAMISAGLVALDHLSSADKGKTGS
jgi:CMP-N,N'-diacetyllegionaminic acid synthase